MLMNDPILDPRLLRTKVAQNEVAINGPAPSGKPPVPVDPTPAMKIVKPQAQRQASKISGLPLTKTAVRKRGLLGGFVDYTRDSLAANNTVTQRPNDPRISPESRQPLGP